MAFSNRLVCESFVASTDLSAGQYRIVDLTAAAKITGSAANLGYGVLQNAPQAGEHGTVAIGGITKVQAGAAVSIGDYIVSAASGFASTLTSGGATKRVFGRALSSAASGSVFSMEIDKFWSVQTGALPA